MNQPLQQFKAEFFKALGHPTRIRILELLSNGEKSVGELQQEMASAGSTVSQQLAILRMKNVVDTRKAGNLIYYRLRNPLIVDLLEVARRIFVSHVTELRFHDRRRLREQTCATPRRSLTETQRLG